jgi:hypothetical protein
MRACADDTDEVRRAAAEIGYPVVLKTGEESITHRTELGLVTAGIDSDAALTAALEVMRERAAAAGVGEHPSWLVQDMARGQLELVITVRDAGQLGVFGSVGIGGAAVEVLRDVGSVPLPCDEDTLRRALSRLRAAELLFGFRGSSPVDIAWIHAALHRLANVLRGDGLAEIEVNPAVVGANGGVVVDALLVR